LKKVTLQHDEVKRIKSSLELEGTVWRDPDSDKTYILPLCREIEMQPPSLLVIDDVSELEMLNHAFLVDCERFFGKRRKAAKAAVGIARSKANQSLIWEVFRRDKFCCFYCGYDTGVLTYDHYLPVSLGGLTNLENGRAACKWCNQIKADREPEDWEASKTLRERRELVKKQKHHANRSV
jgi:hypothetical protein